MKWRTPHILLEIFVATVVALLVLAAVGLWRLSQGPVSISFLTPHVSQLLADIPSVRIDVRDTILTWSGWRRPVDVRAVGVTATATDGRLIASVPELSIQLSIRALLRGELEPTRLEVYEPVVQLLRTESGEYQIGIGQEEGQSTDRFSGFADVLLAPLRPNRPLAYLQQVSIIDGSLTVDDRSLDLLWGAPKAFASIERGKDRVEIRFDLQTDLGDQIPHIRGSGRYIPARKEIEIDTDIAGFWPSRLAAKAPAFARLAPANLPVNASVQLSLDSDLSWKTGTVEISAGVGQIDLPDVLPKPASVRSVKARGVLKQFPQRFVLETFDIDLGGPRLNARAVVTKVDRIAAINGEAVMHGMPVATLRNYWPKGASPGGLAWVSRNLTDGTIREARTSLIAHVDVTSGSIEIDSVTGKLQTQGLAVHYLRPLPPVTGIDARGRFGADFLTFDIRKGTTSGIDVEGGSVKLLGLGSKNERLNVDVVLNGPLRNALELLDNPRFGYAKELGIEPSNVTGAAATRLRVALPLIDKLPFSKVAIQAESEMSAVSIPGILVGDGVSDGKVSMRLDNKAMTMAGHARIGGVPADLSLARNFEDLETFLTRATVKATVEPEHLKNLNISLAPYVAGPVGVDLTVIERSDKSADIEGKLDFRSATLAVPQLSWSKANGESAAGSFTLSADTTRELRTARFDLAAGSLELRGNADFAKDRKSGIRRLQLERFKVGETDLRATLREDKNGERQISIEGPSLDGRPFLTMGESAESDKDVASEPTRPYDLTASIGTLLVGPGRTFQDFSLSGRNDGVHWTNITMSAQMTGDRTVRASLSTAAGKQTVTLGSDDAGAVLKRFAVADGVEGGQLEVFGSRQIGETPTPWTGRAMMKDFRLKQAPTLTRLLTLASLTGIQNVLKGGEGIDFKTLEMPYTLKDRKLSIENGRTVGSEMGLTADGEIDLGADTLDLRGTIVPAYTLNSLLGHIPILGKVFTNKKGSGVFAVTYAVKGSVDKPEASANPLSALTPGFLRNLADVVVEGEPDNRSPLEQSQDQ